VSPRSRRLSHVTGRRQAIAFRAVTVGAWVVAGLAMVVPGSAGVVLAVVAVGTVSAAPVLRVAWLIYRWAQERDPNFVLIGLALLAVIGAGAALGTR